MDDLTTPAPMQVSVVPSPEERTAIRKKYSLTAIVLIVNTFLFNFLGGVVPTLIFAAVGGGFSEEALAAGRQAIVEHEVILTLLSVLPPIISEVTSILLGIKFFGIDFKRLVSNRDGYGSGTIIKLITLSLGLQLAAGVAAAILQMIFAFFGMESPTPDLSGTNSFAANLILSFYACLLGPVLEEFLYRGVVLQSMRKYNERFAIFLSAAIFGLMHQNYQQFILGFLLGIPLAAVTLKYNSLIPSIFTHIFVNISGMLTTYILQYFCPEYYEAIISGAVSDDISFGTSKMLVILIIGAVRIAFAAAGLVVGIVALAKGRNMKRPTPAGKSRAFPIIVRSVPWWIVMAAYVYLAFFEPFITA